MRLMMDILLTLLLMAVLLILKGFFSGSEIAMVNADKVKPVSYTHLTLPTKA